MQQHTISTIEWAASASKDGTAHFGDIVQALVQAGVESYHADYRAGRTTYYLPDGDTHTVTLEIAASGIAEKFDAAAIIAAIKVSQRGEVKYPEFLSLSSAAGCVGYIVWLAGRHVTYFGRQGETHVERFPD